MYNGSRCKCCMFSSYPMPNLKKRGPIINQSVNAIKMKKTPAQKKHDTIPTQGKHTHLKYEEGNKHANMQKKGWSWLLPTCKWN